MKFVQPKTLLLTLLLSLLIATATGQEEEEPAVVDLSSPDLEASPLINDSPGAKELLAAAANEPALRAFTLLEDGLVVAEYVRDDVDVTVPQPVFSTTKTWFGLMVGLMVQDGVLSVEETLGEIFDDPTLWQNMTDAEFRRDVTIQQLLAMNSGLQEEEEEEGDDDADEGDDEYVDMGTLGGGSLFEAIQEPIINPNRTFSHVGSNNILSYVVPQRTNYSTPREYLEAKVLPPLGISEDSIDWWRNEEGLEYAFQGLFLTPTPMAKLGQLYLQGGKTNETHQFINEEWVDESWSLPRGNRFYGLLWWVFQGPIMQRMGLESLRCALGLGYQDICISPLTGRVLVQLRDLSDDYDSTSQPLSPLTLTALHPDLLFNISSSDVEDDSGADADAEGDEASEGEEAVAETTGNDATGEETASAANEEAAPEIDVVEENGSSAATAPLVPAAAAIVGVATSFVALVGGIMY